MQLGIEEVLKSGIKVYGGLLQGNGISLSKPTITATSLGHSQQRFQVLSGRKILSSHLVPVRLDGQSFISGESHSTELTVQKFRLFWCWVDSYFGGS